MIAGFDFLKWQLEMSPNPFSQSNLAIRETQYGTGAPLTAASAAVPEPTSLILLSLDGILALRSFRVTAFTA